MSGGNSSHTRSDTLSDYWYIESKLKAKVPFLKDFRSENERALARDRMPLCIYVSGGISYVFLKYVDFVRMVNACNPGEGKCTTDDLFFCSNWYIWTEYNKDMPYKSTFIDTQKKAALRKAETFPEAKRGLQILLRSCPIWNLRPSSKCCQTSLSPPLAGCRAA